MRRGYSDALRALCEGPQDHSVDVTEIVQLGAGEDCRATYDELNAGSKSNVEVWHEDGLGAARLDAASTAVISHGAGSDELTSITPAWPRRVLVWEVDEAVSEAARLQSLSFRLSRRRIAGAPFDGVFVVTVWAVARYVQSDVVRFQLRKVVEARPVPAAALSADLADVTFSFGSLNDASVPPPPVLGQTFRSEALTGSTPPVGSPGTRKVYITIEAQGGSNTNYALIYDSGAGTSVNQANIGTVYHRRATFDTGTVSAGTMVGQVLKAHALDTTGVAGMIRFSISTISFDASGTLTFTDIDLGGAPTGTVRFVLRASVPAGTALVAEVSDDGGATWEEFSDGQTAEEVGVTAQQAYRIRLTFTADASQDASPTVYEVGARDEVADDVSPIATWESVDEQVDFGTGQGGVPEAVLRLERTGTRDYAGIEELLSSNNITDLLVRHYVGSPNLPRSDWLLMDVWEVDDVRPGPSAHRLVLVGVTSRCKGQVPVTSGQQNGYILKGASSDLSGGADFNRVLSEGTETATTTAVTTAASTSEISYGFTPAGIPGFLRWPAGDFTVSIDVTAGNADIFAKVRLVRVNAAGAVQEYNRAAAADAWSEEQQLTAAAVYTFQLNGTEWAYGAVTDRLRLDISLRNAAGSPQAVTIRFGGANSQVLAPWSFASYRQPANFALGTVHDHYVTLRDTTIGLPERYRGDVPADDSTVVAKNLLDTDGLRELQRLAFAGSGGTVICDQGRVSYRDLIALRGFAVAAFPLEECQPIADHGFRHRQPIMKVGWGWDGAKVQGVVQTEHAAALSAFGPSRVTAVDATLEEETAKWIAEPELAARLGLWLVNALACGLITVEFAPTFGCPHLQVCDLVAVEQDDLAFLDPVSGEAVRGRWWIVGRIIRRSGHRNQRLTIAAGGPTTLFSVDRSSVRRLPIEGPLVHPVDYSARDRPAVARFGFRAFPIAATVRYAYVAHGTDAPDPVTAADQWTTYSAGDIVEFQRDASALKVLYCYATYQGIRGGIRPVPIEPNAKATIGTLTGTEAGADVTANASNVSGNARRIRWYARKHATNYPTLDNSATGVPDEAFFQGETEVAQDGGLRFTHAGSYVATNHSLWVAVPVDYNGNWGTQTALDYTVAGATTADLDAISWSLDTAGSYPATTRKYDVSWTPNVNVADGTHYLYVGVKINGGARQELFTEGSPDSTTSKNAAEIEYAPNTGDPDIEVLFEWELRLDADDSVVSSGSIPPADTFQGRATA